MLRDEELIPGRYFEDMWMSRPDVDWLYVSINRSGSSFTRTYLLNNGFDKVDPRDNRSTHKLVILREPLDRLMSGVSFWKFGKQFIRNPQRFLTEYEFDHHIKLQTKFLIDVDLDTCTFMKYGSSLKSNLIQFVAEQKTTMLHEPGHWENRITPINTPDGEDMVEPDSESGIRFQIYNAMKDGGKLYETVMTYLEEDYKLYNSVKFYGTN